MPEYRPLRGGEPVKAPESALFDAWIIVKQTVPRPRKNPRWQSFEARRHAALAMPEGSSWQCIVNPVSLTALEGDDGANLTGWIASRSVRCSSDHWQTYTEDAHAIRVLAGGKRELLNEQMELHLRERNEGQTVELSVVLRSDDPRRKPTYGPAYRRRAEKGSPAPPSSAGKGRSE